MLTPQQITEKAEAKYPHRSDNPDIKSAVDTRRETYISAYQDFQEEVSKEWVSVEDRLPYKDGDSYIYCLVKIIHNDIVVRPYNEYHKCWDQEDGDDYYTEAVGGHVTHWMPLPSPPPSQP